MSFLREQFENVQREYASVRYPGNLAGEFLTPQMRWRRIIVFGGSGVGAIAASVLVAAMLLQPMLASRNPRTSRSYLPLVKDLQLPEKLPFDFPSLPGLPDALSFRSVSPNLDPSGWHLPFWNEPTAKPPTDSSEHA